MRVLKKAKIIFENGTRSYPVTVRNLSEEGALLQLSEPQAVPSEFVLQIDLDNFRVPCRRVWDEGLSYGVEFTGDRELLGREMAQALQASDSLRSSLGIKAPSEDDEDQFGNGSNRSLRRPSKPGFGRRRSDRV